MQIKITDKILSIPPYISTSWAHIAALHMKGNLLVITLTDGNTVNVSNLAKETIDLIFNYHAVYLEKENSTPLSVEKRDSFNGLFEQAGDSSMRLILGSADGLSNVTQHNPAQADAPDLPSELLQKISTITKIVMPLDESFTPKAEPSCNCFHCQIARALNPTPVETQDKDHEVVKDEELQFQQWDIKPIGDKLFSVVNRLDTHETYRVYLGQPVGCTCGGSGCEHILAVLKS